MVGVEGSLIYFAGPRDREWRHDFETLTSSAGSDRLDKFDHLSNVVRRGEFLSWSLFYHTILGLQPQPQIELADPHGAFFSRLLRSSNGELRIALNIGDGGATGVSRFLETFGGAGFQQIAFATSNIFAAVEASIARGVEFLPIPDNYYDDLETRVVHAPTCSGACRRWACFTTRRPTGGSFTSTPVRSAIDFSSRLSSAATTICLAQRTLRCALPPRRA